jgi:DNA-directed RNA polymerase subunit RPC12/RpoP
MANYECRRCGKKFRSRSKYENHNVGVDCAKQSGLNNYSSSQENNSS